MEYRQLGKSGIEVPVIGFGCGGNARLMVEDDEELRLATIARALEVGINYFDTAAAYGDGRSETNLGRALRELDAHPVISTKVVLQSDDLGDCRSAVLRNFDEGLARLGVDRVDALMLHNRVFEQPKAGNYAVGAQLSLQHMFGENGVVSAFTELVEAGRTKTVGFTTYGGDVSCINEMIDSGIFGAVNSSFNFLNPSALLPVGAGFAETNYGEVAARAGAAGMGVMAIQVLARGVLTGDGPDEAPASEIAHAARALDESLPSAATRYVLGKNEVSTAILGLSEPAHVDAAVAAVERGPLDPAASAELEQMATRK